MNDDKSIYFKLAKTEETGFYIQHDDLPHFYNHLHHHPELQLIYIIKGTGNLFIGDSITSFNSGELFLIGSNQNHLLNSDPEYFEDDCKKRSESVSIFFHNKSLGKKFFEISEMSKIYNLMERSKRGLKFSPEVSDSVGTKMLQLLEVNNEFTRFIEILKILYSLADTQKFKYLAKISSSQPPTDKESRRIDAVINYIFQNFKDDIKLDVIADIAHYSKAAFCTFFKQSTRKTFSAFLNEVRISHACKLLKKTDMNIFQVGFECGYNNISHFNRQFKKYTGLTPRKYLKKYKRSLENPTNNYYELQE